MSSRRIASLRYFAALTILAIVAGSSLSSCKDDDDPVSVHDTLIVRDTARGVVQGRVSIVDSNNDLRANSAGVVVTAVGLTQSTLSDSTGRWILAGVPPGNYTIVLSKDGFGEMQIFNVLVLAGAPVFAPQTYLGQTPRTRLVLDSATIFEKPEWQTLSYFHAIDSSEQVRYSVTIISKERELPIQSVNTVMFVNDQMLPSTATLLGTGQLKTRALDFYGFRKGERVFVSVRSIPPIYNRDRFLPSSYTDPWLSRSLFTSLGPASNVIETVVQ